MLFKGISHLELWQPFCSAEPNHLCNFGREHLWVEVEGIMRNNSVKLFRTWASVGSGDVF